MMPLEKDGQPGKLSFCKRKPSRSRQWVHGGRQLGLRTSFTQWNPQSAGSFRTHPFSNLQLLQGCRLLRPAGIDASGRAELTKGVASGFGQPPAGPDMRKKKGTSDTQFVWDRYLCILTRKERKKNSALSPCIAPCHQLPRILLPLLSPFLSPSESRQSACLKPPKHWQTLGHDDYQHIQYAAKLLLNEAWTAQHGMTPSVRCIWETLHYAYQDERVTITARPFPPICDEPDGYAKQPAAGFLFRVDLPIQAFPHASI